MSNLKIYNQLKSVTEALENYSDRRKYGKRNKKTICEY